MLRNTAVMRRKSEWTTQLSSKLSLEFYVRLHYRRRYHRHQGAEAATKAKATKTSLENKHLGKLWPFCDYIASSPYPLWLTEHAANGLVEAPLKQIQRMRDLLLCVHFVVKTLRFGHFTLSFGKLRQELYWSACRTCSTIIFPHSTNQIIVFWRCRLRSLRPA